MTKNLETRAKRFAIILNLLFQRQNLAGGQLALATRGARYLSLGVRLRNPTDLDKCLKLSESVALAANVENVLAQRQTGLVVYQFELPPGFWESYTRADLPTSEAVGLGEARTPVNFELDPPHALIAGTTGAGKSETLKSVLVALVQNYSVGDLGLILIDPHRELEDFESEAHLVMPIAYSPGEIRHALAYANQELAHRKAENIKDDKAIVIAIDEGAADEVLKNADNLAVMKNISEQARKYHIHLILGTQKPTHGDLPGILDKLLNKFVGQLSDAKTSANVTGHAGLMCHKLTPKGDFLHITGPDVVRFQVAQATRQDFDKLERREVNPVRVVTPDVVELPAEVEPAPVGRPSLEVEPKTLALYYYQGPPNISRKMARQRGISRTSHELHSKFCMEFAKEYLKLRQHPFIERGMLNGQ